MRHKYNGVYRDGAGNVVTSGTISVYLAGTSTSATVYTSSTSTTAVNSVTSSTTDGSFEFYVDRFDYNRDQQFKIILSKSGLTSKTYDYVKIDDLVTGTYSISADRTVSTDLGYVPKGVIYSIATGITLTINGTMDAGDYQIFSCSGTGKVVFSYKRYVYPEWWGVDGTSDDVEIQAAAFSLANGGVVSLSPRTYTQSTYIYIPTKVTLSGSGYGTVLETTAAFGNTYQVRTYPDQPTTDGDRATGIVIENIRFDGSKNTTFTPTVPGVTNAGGHAVALSCVTHSVVRNCWFMSPAGDGIYMRINQTNFVVNDDIEITGNFFYDCQRNAVSDLGGNRHSITNNVINTTKLFGIDIEPNVDVPTKNILVSGNNVASTDSHSLSVGLTYVSTASNQGNITVSNNNVRASGGSGVMVINTVSHVDVIGNTILDPVGAGIYQYSGAEDVSIIGNSIYNSDSYAIRIADGKTVIINNTISADAQTAIFIGGADNAVVNGNIIYLDGAYIGMYFSSISGTAMASSNYIKGTLNGASPYAGSKGISDGGSTYFLFNNNFISTVATGINLSSTSEGIRENNLFIGNTANITDTRTATGTVTLSTYGVTRLDGTSGVVTATLPDGQYVGQTKTIIAINVDNAVTVSVTHHETTDPEVFTFDTVGDSLYLMWDGTDWVTIKNKGVTI